MRVADIFLVLYFNIEIFNFLVLADELKLLTFARVFVHPQTLLLWLYYNRLQGPIYLCAKIRQNQSSGLGVKAYETNKQNSLSHL